MIDAEDHSSDSHPPETEVAHSGLVLQLVMMARALLASPVGKSLIALTVAAFAVIVATAYGQVWLNRWNQPFYDALTRRDFRDFVFELGMFFIIAGCLLVLNVAQRWLVEALKVKLREGLVGDLIRDWMSPRRAFWLANAGPMGVNPDQRMHEDARHLCELSAALGTELMQATVLLVTFIGVLWVLSRGFMITIAGHEVPVPGYMVWAAILYAGIGSLLSYWVGGSLIGRNAERYAREADLRFALVRVNEHLDGITLAAGEEGERRRLETSLGAVLQATWRLVTGLTNLTWITAGFGWVMIVAPILVAAPLYFDGRLTFGGMMMAAAAFTQAQSSLRWFVDNFSQIADWRATLLRVANFRRAVVTTDVKHEVESHIAYVEGIAGRIVIESLEIASPAGRDMMREQTVEVRTGERLLIVGEPGTNKTLLFRALAGLWPLGTGRVVMPAGEQILYFPRGTPYLPQGSLREVLAYPLKHEGFDADTCAHALRRLGLERLVPLLEISRRWDRELSEDEQLALAFARVLLQAPAWLLIDGVFGSLDGDTLERVIDVFGHELARTGVIHIGGAQSRDPLFARVVHLVKCPAQRLTDPPVARGQASQVRDGRS
ncbi:MAG: ABC transporter ATP-binding protein/permease [Proteobacteria bacterium]|nr:ABC transporter ATP-binding protein/permease [Pseudomonadota bacterium]